MTQEELLASDFLPAERMPFEGLQAWNRLVCSCPPLTKMMDDAPFGIALLNEQRQIVYSNQYAFDLAGIGSTPAVLGLRPGELFGCVHSEKREGGCGTSLACQSCHVANSIVEALAWGEGAGVERLHVDQARTSRLDIHMHNSSVYVGNGRLLLCRLGDFAPRMPAFPPEECPVELQELYLALAEPVPASC